MSLVPDDAAFLVWAFVVAITGLGFWAEKHTRLGAAVTGIVVAMMTAMVLSNARVLPFESSVYDTIFEAILPVSIPLMLFRADVVLAVRKGGATVASFAIGTVGVVLGAAVASWCVPLGDLTAVAAGLFTATYVGGSANFAAVAIAADFDDGTILTSMIAADIVATNLQTILLVGLPGIVLIQRLFRVSEAATSGAVEASASDGSKGLDLPGAAFALAVAMLLVYLGNATAEALGRPTMGIVVTTLYTLVISNFVKPLVRVMAHDFEIGLFFIFLFLVALAAGADVSVMIETGLSFFVFAMLLLLVHTAFTLSAGRLLGLDLRSVIIGSSACVGGVTSAAAIASAKSWRDLIIPGILAGTLGNAIGTLVGVSMWSALGG